MAFHQESVILDCLPSSNSMFELVKVHNCPVSPCFSDVKVHLLPLIAYPSICSYLILV